jgi:hypothetical protein
LICCLIMEILQSKFRQLTLLKKINKKQSRCQVGQRSQL